MAQVLNYTLAFDSPVSIFSGMAVAGLVDRMVVRDHEGLPIIPGSTVKGRWRFYAERLLQTGSAPARYRMHAKGGPMCKRIEDACTICRIFGSSAIPSAVWVGQAELDGEARAEIEALLDLNPNPVIRPDAEIRPGIALSRTRRTAYRDHLFFDEVVPAQIRFSGKVRFKRELRPEEMDFLRLSAKTVDRIGGRKGAGRGLISGIRIGDAS